MHILIKGGSMPKDYYVVLGVSRGADLKRIKKAYREAVKRLHPDVIRSDRETEKFLEAREAYETLIDETRRKQYDELLIERGSDLKIKRAPEELMNRASGFDDIERLFSSGADDFFEGFIPGFFDIHKGRIGEKDLYFEAILSPGEAEAGGLYPLSLPIIEACQRCRKKGLWEGFVCPECSGYGRVKAEKRFSLSIPPHVKHGTQIRISMQDIGLRNVWLNITVFIDPGLEEGW
jgi:molecular chaperone DnaJ